MKRLRVGILTMHRVHNCGSFLQTYALQQTLEKLSFDCEIIDYMYPNSLHGQNDNYYPITLSNSTKHILQNIYHHRWSLVKKQIHEIIWDRMLHRKLKLSAKSYNSCEELQSNPPRYDVYVLGSDQVWNELFICNDLSFFLGFVPKGRKCVSYASSAPNMQFSESFKNNVKLYLSRLVSISARERMSAEAIGQLVCRNVESHLDPVFLLTADEWERELRIKKRKGNYVLFYVLNYMGDIRQYAYKELQDLLSRRDVKEKQVYSNCEIPSVSAQILKEMNPSEFIQTITNADYVLTDSFHAASFALIFNVPFKPIIANKEQDIRIVDLCERLGERDSLGYIYGDADKINEERIKAITYLNENVG